MQPKKRTSIRKEEIVAAALQIVGERGVRGLTIAAIASRAEMSDANIYRHFKGKREILAALGDFVGEAVMGKAVRVAARRIDPLAKLAAIFRSHTALVAATPGLPRFIFSEELHHGDRQLAASVAGRMGHYVETLGGIIAEGVGSGLFRRDLSPRETAITMLGMIQFTALRWSISQRSFSLEREAARLWENFEKLLLESAAGGRAGEKAMEGA